MISKSTVNKSLEKPENRAKGVDWAVLRKDFPYLEKHVFLDTIYSCPYFRVWDEAFISFKETHENRRGFVEDLESFKPVFPEETDHAF